MARRLDAGERARIEVLAARGFSDAQIAAQLGRGRATIWREKKRRRGAAYCAQAAQADADARAKRPRVPRLAGDSVLARLVQDRSFKQAMVCPAVRPAVSAICFVAVPSPLQPRGR